MEVFLKSLNLSELFRTSETSLKLMGVPLKSLNFPERSGLIVPSRSSQISHEVVGTSLTFHEFSIYGTFQDPVIFLKFLENS